MHVHWQRTQGAVLYTQRLAAHSMQPRPCSRTHNTAASHHPAKAAPTCQDMHLSSQAPAAGTALGPVSSGPRGWRGRVAPTPNLLEEHACKSTCKCCPFFWSRQVCIWGVHAWRGRRGQATLGRGGALSRPLPGSRHSAWLAVGAACKAETRCCCPACPVALCSAPSNTLLAGQPLVQLCTPPTPHE